MKLKLQTRLVFGRPLYYAMCDTSRLLSQLGRRYKSKINTFCPRDLAILVELGYEIEEVPQFTEVKL